MNTKKRKRMKLPNGFGSVVLRTDGNRRRPWSVKVTINGRQKSIGDTATEIEGLALLAEYHKNPSLFAPTLITFSEVFELMRAERFPKLAKTTQVNYLSAYKHCHRLYGKKFAELKIGDLQAVIRDTRNAGAHYGMQKKVRQILHHCYTYAVKYEIISPTADISQYIDIDQHKVKYPKTPFNTRQINRVKNLGDKWAMTVLMMIYAGVRTSELLSILKNDVKLRQRYFIVRESKTAAGRNRAVPISKKTLPFFEFWMQQPGKHLITNDDGSLLTYHQYRARFDAVMVASKCKHTPHECRHTCATMLDNAGANETAIKRILGHASQGVTKRVYTHKSLHELKKAIDLI